MKKFFLGIWGFFEPILIAAAIVFVIRFFIAQPFMVSGASMEPTFSNGNYIIIDEITYRFRGPERGEVVVFNYPKNPSLFFIKRVVGLPNERIVVEDGRVRIFNKAFKDGFVLDEKYLPVGLKTAGKLDTVLKPDEYFVMGDNRYQSFDSRNWGAVPKSEIIGIARLRILPLTKIAAFTY